MAVASAADVAAAEDGVGAGCPEGYYRTAAVIFACGGGSGLIRILAAPKQKTDVVNISKGVRFFRVRASSDSAVSLELYDPKGQAYVAARDRGAANEKHRSGTYKGVGVVFSDKPLTRGAPPEERLYVLGALSASVVLRVNSQSKAWAEVALNYSYDGHESCPQQPEGCSAFNESSAREELASWSDWAQAKFRSGDEAWAALASNASREAGSVAWQDWPSLWAQGNGQDVQEALAHGENWQPGFRLLDADDDGEVSRAEFEAGFRLHGAHEARLSAWLDWKSKIYFQVGIAAAVALVPLAVMVVLYTGCLRSGKRKTRGAILSDPEQKELFAVEVPEQDVGYVPGRKHSVESPSSLRSDSAVSSHGSATPGGGAWLGAAAGLGLAVPPGPGGWGLWSGGLSWPLAPSQNSFRYGPVPSFEEPSPHPAAGSAGASGRYPASHLQMTSAHLASGGPAPLAASVSFTSVVGTPGGPLPPQQGGQRLAPSEVLGMWAAEPIATGNRSAMKVSGSSGTSSAATAGSTRHRAGSPILVRERSHSFTRAIVEDTGQSIPAVATMERSYSFTRATAHGGEDAKPTSREEVEAVRAALQKQAPWSAIFTPEEWAQTSQRMQQGAAPSMPLLQLQPYS